MRLDRYSSQIIDEGDIEAVVRALKSGVLTQGAAVEAFENALCEYTGAKYAIAVNSATAALHISYLAAGLGANDEVIVPAITFAATANAAIYCGGASVFADVDFASGLIDINAIEALITPKTKAIAPVHYAGSLCDMEAIGAVAARRNLIVIEDAAHALGSFDAANKSAGTFGAMGVFSFHPVKPITTGEGGAIVTSDAELAKKARLLRSHGIARGDLWEQDMIALGFNYRVSDLNCALGVSQLKRIDKTIKRREEIATLYDRAFANSDRITPLKTPTKTRQKTHSRHLYPILLDSAIDKTKLFNKMREKNIGVQVHYKPVYSHSYYIKRFGERFLPQSEAFYRSELSLPCHSALSDDEIAFVIETILSD
ncbi:MAG: UDP-4-amino-4,6-dideoxy-N-acetyl-beta-L-altrosamine transaminase [Helicobacteraceae bacterium]|nr:UDP-4-amino-4,6-dideoxy-N-acetyl-beta-L-altrosamine transaminase [Helicobacteraceae bacterium]